MRHHGDRVSGVFHGRTGALQRAASWDWATGVGWESTGGLEERLAHSTTPDHPLPLGPWASLDPKDALA
jgi:hypothetical protein